MDDLRALAEAATKGWDRPRLVDLYNASELSLDGCRYVQAIDPTTLLALLDERDALREALQAAEAELRDTKRGIIAGLRWLGRPLVITPHNLMDDDGWAMESSERLDGSIELRAVRAALASARDGAGEGGA